jgi:hypothetical protein
VWTKTTRKGCIWELKANHEGDVPLCMTAALIGACFLGTATSGRTCAGCGILRHLNRATTVIHDNKVVVVRNARPFFDVVSCRWFATPTSNFGPHPDVHIAFEPVPLVRSLPCTLLNTEGQLLASKLTCKQT